MIKDNIKNAELYYALSPRIKEGLEWIKHNNLYKMEDGKYIIDENNIYANIQTYVTKDNAHFEAHKEYIDIQYMINGKEKIGVLDYTKCNCQEKYNKEKDIEFLDNKVDFTYQEIEDGEFLILFPTDAHKPSIKIKENKEVKKVVIKIKI